MELGEEAVANRKTLQVSCGNIISVIDLYYSNYRINKCQFQDAKIIVRKVKIMKKVRHHLLVLICAILMIGLAFPVFGKPAAAAAAPTVIQTSFDYVAPFSEGLAVVMKNGKIGYVDKQGEVVIPLIYELYSEDYGPMGADFREGLAAVKKNGKVGFIDKTGKEKIPFIYTHADSFSEGLAAACTGDMRCGYINKDGKVVVPMKYAFADAFYEGTARVKNQAWMTGYIDSDGKEIVPAIYEGGFSFSEGLAFVGKSGRWGYIDKSGREAIPFNYEYINEWEGSFHDGLAVVKRNQRFGFIDKSGREVIPLIYESASFFKDGMGTVSLDYSWGYVDRQGEVLLSIGFNDTLPFNEGLAAAANRYGEYGYIDMNGKTVIPFKYESAFPFYEGAARVGLNGKYGFIDQSGEVIVPIEYDDVTFRFTEGLAWGKKDGKWHIIDKTDPQSAPPAGQTTSPASHYVYNEEDIGASWEPDFYTQLWQTTGHPWYAMRELIDTMSTDLKQSATAIDKIIHYGEESQIRGASRLLESGDIVLNKDMLRNVEIDALGAVDIMTSDLAKEEIVASRDIRPIGYFHVSGKEGFTITVEPSAAETKLAFVQFITTNYPKFALTINMKSMQQELADGKPLVITVEPVADNQVKVTFNKSRLQEPVKLSLFPIDADPTYQTVALADGTPVPSKFNPVSVMMDARITSGQTFTVKMNRKDFRDIQTKPDEMQIAIRYLASKGIISGTSETTFNPDGSISRAEFAALVLRALGKLDPDANGNFKDVTRRDWYYGAAGSAVRSGLISGYEDNTFRGGLPIPKEQVVAIVARTLRSEMGYRPLANPSSFLNYSDKAAIPNWAIDDIALATRENLVLRRSDASFNPGANMTRGDAAIIVKRLFDRIW